MTTLATRNPVLKSTIVQSAGLGIAMMAVSMLIVPVVDGTAKYLSAAHSPLFLGWARYASACLFVLPWAIARHGRAFLPGEGLAAHGSAHDFPRRGDDLLFPGHRDCAAGRCHSCLFRRANRGDGTGGAVSRRADHTAQADQPRAWLHRRFGHRQSDRSAESRPAARRRLRRAIRPLHDRHATGIARQRPGEDAGVPMSLRRNSAGAAGHLDLVDARNRRALAVSCDGSVSAACHSYRSRPFGTPRHPSSLRLFISNWLAR